MKPKFLPTTLMRNSFLLKGGAHDLGYKCIGYAPTLIAEITFFIVPSDANHPTLIIELFSGHL